MTTKYNMASVKKTVKEPDFLAFSNTAGPAIPSRDIQKEVHNKVTSEPSFDDFEKMLAGAAPKPASRKAIKKGNFKPKVFDMDLAKDRELLTELFNSPNHVIQYYKDNWTPMGGYRAFVIYAEILKTD